MYKFTTYVDLIIWFLPPFRQYKGGYFIYFLLIAITPLSAQIFLYYFHLYPGSFYVISSASIIIALQYYKDKKILSGILLFLTFCPLIIYLNYYKVNYWVNGFMHSIRLFYICFFLLEYMYNKKTINIYFIILVVYEISVILKILTMLNNIHTGLLYYHVTSVFEFVICLYFVFFNIENSPQIKLYNAPSSQ
jgi:hypothetical protein